MSEVTTIEKPSRMAVLELRLERMKGETQLGKMLGMLPSQYQELVIEEVAILRDKLAAATPALPSTGEAVPLADAELAANYARADTGTFKLVTGFLGERSIGILEADGGTRHFMSLVSQHYLDTHRHQPHYVDRILAGDKLVIDALNALPGLLARLTAAEAKAATRSSSSVEGGDADNSIAVYGEWEMGLRKRIEAQRMDFTEVAECVSEIPQLFKIIDALRNELGRAGGEIHDLKAASPTPTKGAGHA